MCPLSRRRFLILGSAAAAVPGAVFSSPEDITLEPHARVAELERPRVLKAAEAYLKMEPRTIVSAVAPRSAGGPHDYFSEGDYWWPDPKNPDGPYIRRDGETNPVNFVAHRDLLIRFSIQASALAAAWLLIRRRRFAEHVAAHLRAWFTEPATRMNPNLLISRRNCLGGCSAGVSLHCISDLGIRSHRQSPERLANYNEGISKWTFGAHAKRLGTEAEPEHETAFG